MLRVYRPTILPSAVYYDEEVNEYVRSNQTATNGLHQLWHRSFILLCISCFIISYIQWYISAYYHIQAEIDLFHLSPTNPSCEALLVHETWTKTLLSYIQSNHDKEDCSKWLKLMNRSPFPNILVVLIDMITNLFVHPIPILMENIGLGVHYLLEQHGFILQALLLLWIPIVVVFVFVVLFCVRRWFAFSNKNTVKKRNVLRYNKMLTQ